MNYASKTKDNLIKILDMKDRELDTHLVDFINIAKKNDDLNDQQLILFWLLFIIAGIGFSF